MHHYFVLTSVCSVSAPLVRPKGILAHVPTVNGCLQEWGGSVCVVCISVCVYCIIVDKVLAYVSLIQLVYKATLLPFLLCKKVSPCNAFVFEMGAPLNSQMLWRCALSLARLRTTAYSHPNGLKFHTLLTVFWFPNFHVGHPHCS